MDNVFGYNQKKYLKLSYISQAILIFSPIITFIIGFFVANVDDIIVKIILNTLDINDILKIGILVGVSLIIDIFAFIIGVVLAIIAKKKYDGEKNNIIFIGQIIIIIMYSVSVGLFLAIIVGIIHLIITLIPILIIFGLILLIVINS